MHLDHINVRTTDLKATTDFLIGIAGLKTGPRPTMSFNGAWLYDDSDRPVVHLVEVEKEFDAPGPVDHFAFLGDDLDGSRRYLQEAGLSFTERAQPGRGATQLFVKGPGYITVELQFPTDT